MRFLLLKMNNVLLKTQIQNALNQIFTSNVFVNLLLNYGFKRTAIGLFVFADYRTFNRGFKMRFLLIKLKFCLIKIDFNMLKIILLQPFVL